MRLTLPLCLALLVLSGASRAQGPVLTAEQVARRVQDRDAGRDSRAEFRMKLFDRRSRVRERALSLLTLRGREAPGAPKTAPDGDRLLIRFTYPNDIRGTSFLVWKHPKGEDERFLYLPSLGRVRRIAGSEAQESFVGSDFSYEDIGGRDFDDYSYALPDANATWTGPDGAARPAYRLESRRRDRSVEFPRVVSLVLKDTFVVVQADVYNRRDEKQKVYAVTRLQQVQGIWTVMASSMANDLEKTRTELAVERIDYNTGVTEDAFSRRALEGAGR
jgi:outer membrane lipoprotein-sorting protein